MGIELVHFSTGKPKQMKYGEDKEMITGICKDPTEEAFLSNVAAFVPKLYVRGARHRTPFQARTADRYRGEVLHSYPKTHALWAKDKA